MRQSHPERGRVDELDGVRGVLALWVAVAHVLCWTGFWDFFTVPRPGGRLFVAFIDASPAVDTFIILSGFAISFLLHERDQGYGAFMKGRLFRIYPVYLVCLTLGLISALVTPFILGTASWKSSGYFGLMQSLSTSEASATGKHLLAHLTLLNGLLTKTMLPDANVTLLAPAWSITLEWQYYLLAPMVAWLVRSGTGLLMLTAAAVVGLHYGDAWRNPHLAFFPAQLPLFLIGIGSYHLYVRFRASGRKRMSAYAVAVAAVVAVAALVSWHSVGLVLWALGFGCIFVEASADPFSRVLGGVRAALLHPWLQKLGRVSYPLYLVHWPLILLIVSGMLWVWPTIPSKLAGAVLFCLGMPLILGAAAVLHVFVEAPMMAFGKRSRKAAPSAAYTTADQVAKLTPP